MTTRQDAAFTGRQDARRYRRCARRHGHDRRGGIGTASPLEGITG